jgi:hypothetical protein
MLKKEPEDRLTVDQVKKQWKTVSKTESKFNLTIKIIISKFNLKGKQDFAGSLKDSKKKEG